MARKKISTTVYITPEQNELLKELLAHIGSVETSEDARTGASVEPLIEHLSANLADLEGLVKKRLFIAGQKANLIRQLGQVSIVAQRMIAPGARILEAQIAGWNSSNEAATSDQLSVERSLHSSRRMLSQVSMRR